MAAYPDLKIWYSYVSDIYVIETPRLDKIQFLLDGNDFIKEGGPDFDNDMTILQPSEFKKDRNQSNQNFRLCRRLFLKSNDCPVLIPVIPILQILCQTSITKPIAMN